MPDDDGPSKSEVNYQLRQAKQALSDAEGAQNAELIGGKRVHGDARGLNGVHDAGRLSDKLFVYGPGGYRVSAFLRVGMPLSFLLSVVIIRRIVFFWSPCVSE